MIDLKQIENEINELNTRLSQKKREYEKTKENNLKEQYGDNFGCDNCVYSCCVDVGDHHTYCHQNHCIYCYSYCDEYILDNELSAYIRNKHYYDENTLDAINELFNVDDIMQHPELYQKALDVLAILDKKEN